MTTDKYRDTSASRHTAKATKLLRLRLRILFGVAMVLLAGALSALLAFTTSLPLPVCVLGGLALAAILTYAFRSNLFRGEGYDHTNM